MVRVTRATIPAIVTVGLLLSGTAATSQPAGRARDIKSQVLEVLFRDEGLTNDPFVRKWILRYGDTESQLTVVHYSPYDASGRLKKPPAAEIIKQSLAGMGKGKLDAMIDDARRRARGADEKDTPQWYARIAQEIAAKIRVDVRRVPLDIPALDRALDESSLLGIRLSPTIKEEVVCVDDCPPEYEYEYSCDTGRESVRYFLTGPAKGRDVVPQDALVRWMLKFWDAASRLM
jgi:hypothetical protein